jgi:hypothetical protein
MIRDCPIDVYTRNLWQIGEMGNKLGTESTTKVPPMSRSEERVQSVPETGVTCTMYYLRVPKV